MISTQLIKYSVQAKNSLKLNISSPPSYKYLPFFDNNREKTYTETTT